MSASRGDSAVEAGHGTGWTSAIYKLCDDYALLFMNCLYSAYIYITL